VSVSIDYRLPRENQILAALPNEEYQRLIPNLEVVALTHLQMLYDIGETIKYIYFPIKHWFVSCRCWKTVRQLKLV
jgi:hypothetical protein